MRKKERELEHYLEAGAHVKVFENTLADTMVALSKVLPRYEYAPLQRAYDSLAHIKDVAERRMNIEHPEVIDSDFQRVFYGGIQGSGDISKKVESIARVYILNMYYGVQENAVYDGNTELGADGLPLLAGDGKKRMKDVVCE